MTKEIRPIQAIAFEPGKKYLVEIKNSTKISEQEVEFISKEFNRKNIEVMVILTNGEGQKVFVSEDPNGKNSHKR